MSESNLSKQELEQRVARLNATIAGSEPQTHLDAAVAAHERAGAIVDPARKCFYETKAVYRMLRCLQAEQAAKDGADNPTPP